MSEDIKHVFTIIRYNEISFLCVLFSIDDKIVQNKQQIQIANAIALYKTILK